MLERILLGTLKSALGMCDAGRASTTTTTESEPEMSQPSEQPACPCTPTHSCLSHTCIDCGQRTQTVHSPCPTDDVLAASVALATDDSFLR